MPTAQPYRTDENAVMEYLRYMDTNADPATVRNCKQSIGDSAADATIWADDDNPNGGCFMRFLMAKLPPEVSEDQPTPNDAPDALDTPITMDEMVGLELYTRAGCEGFLDQATTEQRNCQGAYSHLYDYTFSNLMLEATGGARPCGGDVKQWFSFLPSVLRPDRPQGHSPLPTTKLCAEGFNDFVNSVNLLDKARVEFPFYVETRVNTSSGFQAVTPSHSTPTLPPGACGGDRNLESGEYAALTTGPGATQTSTPGTWELIGSDPNTLGFSAQNTVRMYRSFDDQPAQWCQGPSGLTWAIATQTQTVEWRVPSAVDLGGGPIPQYQLLALAPELRSMFQAGGFGMMGTLSRASDYFTEGGDPEACGGVTCTSGTFSDGYVIAATEHKPEQSSCLLLPSSGSFGPDAAPSSYLWQWKCTNADDPASFSDNSSSSTIGFTMAGPEAGGSLFLAVPLAD